MMKTFKYPYSCLMLFTMILSSCNFPYKQTNQIIIKNKPLTILNLADIQIDNVKDLNKDTIVNKTITKLIKEQKPDILTLSGDNAWRKNAIDCYKRLTDFLDAFRIPYFLVFGNHDREKASAEELLNIIKESKYGYMDKGTCHDSDGNYRIDIRNKKKKIIHSILMMDSRGKNDEVLDNPVTYIDNPVTGVKYLKYDNKPYIGSRGFDGIRDDQLTWYEDQIKDVKCETTLITHMPIQEYLFAIEGYMSSKNENNMEAIESYKPVGLNRINEHISCCVTNHGLFDLMKSYGSTKNMIVGHDHTNDYSLMYEGIRLTFAVKTGNEYSWYNETMNGGTKLVIDPNGHATLSQVYVNLD